MFIALEGPDGAGKSSLANDLVAALPGTEVTHFSQLKQNPIDEYVLSLQDYEPGVGGNLITDRWHIGEDVYGPLYRGESQLTRAQRRWIELWGLSRGVTLYHVTQPLERLRSRLEARGEDFLKPEDVERVHAEFFAETATSPLLAGSIEPEGDTTALIAEMLKLAAYNESAAQVLTPFRTYIGRPLPSVLLVGEKRGGKPAFASESAFMPRVVNSGSYLLEALSEETWPTVGVCNAVEEGDKLVDLVETLAGPRVIALGRAASDVLLDLGIEHSGVPHPQYVKRFHHKKQREYGVLISDVLRNGDVKFSWPS